MKIKIIGNERKQPVAFKEIAMGEYFIKAEEVLMKLPTVYKKMPSQSDNAVAIGSGYVYDHIEPDRHVYWVELKEIVIEIDW